VRLREIYEKDEETGRAYILRPKLCLLKHRLAGSDDGFSDFVAHLLTVDPLKRPTAEQALTHPWLSHVYEEAV
jgi:serine/threonine protein kinase